MADESGSKSGRFRMSGGHLGADGGLKNVQLAIGKSDEEAFQENDGFAEASIQVVMSGINGAPEAVGGEITAFRNIVGGSAKVLGEPFDHLG